MIIEFKLSMPNVGSWNGKWTGESNYYAKLIEFKGKVKEEKAKELLEKAYYHYSFGDGWSMGVSLRKVDSREAAKIRRMSNGFCGYDWAVDSIIKYKKILVEAPAEIKAVL